MWVNRLDGIHWFNFLVILASFEQISEVSHTLILPTHTGIWTLMCGWVSLCDVKKVNSKHWFFENQKYSYAVNQNKYKFLTRVKDIQTTSFFYKHLSANFEYLKVIFAQTNFHEAENLAFCEYLFLRISIMKTFREDLLLRMRCAEIFRDSAIFRYLARTCFHESRKVTNVYRVEYTISDLFIPYIIT